MTRYWPAFVLFSLPFAYDPWAYDVLTIKYGAWVFCVGLWISVRLWRGGLPSGISWAMGLLVLLYTPSWRQGASWAHTWVPWTQAMALVGWSVLVWDALTHSENKYDLQRTWLRASAVGLVLLSWLAMVEWWQPQWFVWSGAVRGLSNVTMGNPNHLGALLSVGLPIFFVLGGRWRWGLPWVILGIATTGSRLSLITAYVALGIGGLLTLFCGTTQTIRERLRTITWVAFCGLGLWLGATLLTPQKQLADLSEGRGGIAARLHLLRCALPMGREAFPWGLGYGRFRQRFPEYRGRCLQGSRFARVPFHTIAVNLHNDWLQLALEGGLLLLPFLVAVLLWWGWLLARWCGEMRRLHQATPTLQTSTKRAKPHKTKATSSPPRFVPTNDPKELGAPNDPTARIWLLMPMLGLFLQMSGTFPIQLPSVLALSTLCVLLLQHDAPFRWRRKEHLTLAAKQTTPPSETSRRLGALLRWVVWVLWLAVIFFSMRVVRSEHLLVQGMRAIEQRSPHAIDALQQSAALSPSEHAFFQLGQAWLAAGQPQHAIPPLQRAYSILPDVQVSLTLAEAYLALRDPISARRWLLRGLSLQPHHADTHALLRQIPQSIPSPRPNLPNFPTSSPTSNLPRFPTSSPTTRPQGFFQSLPSPLSRPRTQ